MTHRHRFSRTATLSSLNWFHCIASVYIDHTSLAVCRIPFKRCNISFQSYSWCACMIFFCIDAVLWRWRPHDRQNTRPRSPANSLTRFTKPENGWAMAALACSAIQQQCAEGCRLVTEARLSPFFSSPLRMPLLLLCNVVRQSSHLAQWAVSNGQP
jgi:hypothetical protein